MVSRFRRLPLRSRLALLAALAVAVAVAVCATACWFLVRGALIDSLDESLRDSRGRFPDRAVITLLDSGDCRATPPPQNEQGLGDPFRSTVQVVTRDGTGCVVFGRQSLDVTPEDTAVAGGTSEEAVHNAKGSNGAEYRVLTTRLHGTDAAVSVARPLGEVDDSLDSLALVLGLVAGIGVVGAASAGLWIARAGLKPVDRLTEAVEHVARTEDLAIRIPADGEDEIARLSRSFNAMTAALASSRDRQQQLIADAGHELRTPLTSLRTNIELLLRSEETGRALPSDDRRALLDSVRAQVVELASLIGDLQELSRPDAAAGSAGAEVVALHEIADRAVQRARPRGKGLTITADLDPWYVRGESAALERAVINLLDNAVKFSGGDTNAPAGSAGGESAPTGSGGDESAPAGSGGDGDAPAAGSAGDGDGDAPAGSGGEENARAEGIGGAGTGGSVEVALKGGELTVRDHGPGVPADELPHVFERFWRSPSARSLPGSGLGLSIVARAVRQAGGQVALRPAEGGGTVAVVTLPGADRPPPAQPWPTC
ncbi:sensor histidine kinase [Streptomyces sp. NPDC048639]|uniref:sensor histidine kinase n=1 Tax=Streptomyces sp. NPDC048639 TaxID=3365581 RepID=UPI003723FC2B